MGNNRSGEHFTIKVVDFDVIAIDTSLTLSKFSSVKLNKNEWNFITITINNSSIINCYVNNNKTENITMIISNNQYTNIGFGVDLLSHKTANGGYLTDIRMWNRTLNIDEISNVRNFLSITSGLVAAWDCTESEFILKDKVGNLDGIIYGYGVIVDPCTDVAVTTTTRQLQSDGSSLFYSKITLILAFLFVYIVK